MAQKLARLAKVYRSIPPSRDELLAATHPPERPQRHLRLPQEMGQQGITAVEAREVRKASANKCGACEIWTNRSEGHREVSWTQSGVFDASSNVLLYSCRSWVCSSWWTCRE
jgi:hypothetical protein